MVLAQYIDYGFSEEGAMMMNYGVEGQAHTIVDGKPVWTDLIVNNPDGLTFAQACYKYAMPSVWAFLYDSSREASVSSDLAKAASALWHSDRDFSYDFTCHGVLTADEQISVSSDLNDINTYVQEYTNKVIAGLESIDSWDNYVATVKNHNLDKIIETYVAAEERFNNR